MPTGRFDQPRHHLDHRLLPASRQRGFPLAGRQLGCSQRCHKAVGGASSMSYRLVSLAHRQRAVGIERGPRRGDPTLMTEIHERLRRLSARTARAAHGPRSHYLLAVGGGAGWWSSRGDRSFLSPPAQILSVMRVLPGPKMVPTPHPGETPAYIRLISAKLVLVAVAVGAQWLLAPVTSES